MPDFTPTPGTYADRAERARARVELDTAHKRGQIDGSHDRLRHVARTFFTYVAAQHEWIPNLADREARTARAMLEFLLELTDGTPVDQLVALEVFAEVWPIYAPDRVRPVMVPLVPLPMRADVPRETSL